MAAMNDAAVIAGEVEKIRSTVPVLFERDDVLFTMIEKRTDVEIISNRAIRIPIQIAPGGAGSQANFDGGIMGRGSGSSYIFLSASPIDFKFAVELTLAADWDTDSREKAVFSAAKREVINAAKHFRSFMDRLLNTAGNGVLGTISSGAGTPTLTMAAPFGSQLFMPGMPITSYDSTQTTQRTASPTVTSVDYPNGTVTTDIIFTNTPANGDVVCVGGLSGASPVSLFGVPYFQNGANSGNVLGQSRATYPQLRTPQIVASSILTPTHPRQALTRLRQALGVDTPKKGVWYGHVDQWAAWEELSILTQETTPGGSVPDLLYNNESGKVMAGKPFVESVNADPTRIDFLILSNWGRAVVKDVQMVKIGDVSKFPMYDGTSGSPLASYGWYIGWKGQMFDENPRGGCYISSLSKPAGYI